MEIQAQSVDPKTKVVTLLTNNPKSSYENLAKQLNVSASTIKRLIKELKNEGKILRDGAKRGGTWKVVIPNDRTLE